MSIPNGWPLSCGVLDSASFGGAHERVLRQNQARLYLLLHKGNEAAVECQKFLDHRGAIINYPLVALARLDLARAYALQGDKAKSHAIALQRDPSTSDQFASF